MNVETDRAVTARANAGEGEGEEYWTTSETSRFSRVPAETLRYYRHRGVGGPKSFKLGRRVLYARSDVEAWIAAARSSEAR